MKKNYAGSIELTKIPGSVIFTTKKGNRAVLIPIELSHLDEFEAGRVSLVVNVHMNEEKDKHGNDGFIGMKVPTKEYKAIGKEASEALKLPILGNFKDFSEGGSTSAPAPSVTEGADGSYNLPF